MNSRKKRSKNMKTSRENAIIKGAKQGLGKLRKTQLTCDQLSYITIVNMAEHMQLLLNQYGWNEYWCDKSMIALVKEIDKKLVRLSDMAEKKADVEYVYAL